MSGRQPAKTTAWGIFRELAHSPGRETDDALVLQAVAACLEENGFSVALKTAEEIAGGAEEPPANLFVMCERLGILDTLERWEERGARIVNPPGGVRNTYRDRTAALFERERIPFPRSVLVSTSSPAPAGPSGSADLSGCWIKRGDVHNTEPGDVVRARHNADAAAALRDLSRRGVSRALLQEHAPGDLVKFYGIAGPADDPGRDWFQWFYHREQRLQGYSFDPDRLASIARSAAAALGLEIWGGDAIVGPDGSLLLIDLNAWPSFALYRETAAPKIAALLAHRFRRHSLFKVAEWPPR